MTDQATVALTLITARKPAVLSKSFSLGEDGALRKAPGGQLIEGTAQRLHVPFGELPALLPTLKPNQALTYGVSDHEDATVVSQEALQKRAASSQGPVIARDRQHFKWPAGPGVFMIDYDPAPDALPLLQDDLLRALFSVWPGLKDSPHVWSGSASSCIFKASGEELRGLCGQRVYVAVQDASDIPRAGRVLADRLWLAGLARFDVSKSGALLDRPMVDASVWQPERLDFAGGARCGPGLEQRRPAPILFNADGPFIDTRSTLPDLSPEEQDRLKTIKAEARKAMQPEVGRRQDEWVKDRVETALKAIPKAKREGERRRLEDIHRRAVTERRLFGDFLLHSHRYGPVTVGQILDNPEKFHGERFADPLEPDYGNDPRIARANLRRAGRPGLYSHAHGGQSFTLHRALQTVRVEGGELHNIVNRVLELMGLDGLVFDRGGELFRITDGRILPVTPGWLQVYATALARFVKYDKRSDSDRPIDCPQNLAHSLCEMKGSWGLPRLDGIITAPTLCPDGRVIESDGYDPETHLYLDFLNSDHWPGVLARPSDAEVKEAVRKLWHSFREFPFATAKDCGAHLAGLFTACVRPMLKTAPGMLYDAPVAGSGKTLLAQATAELAGQSAEVLLLTEDPEELRKRLFALARIGTGAVLLDNISGAFKSDALCGFLTTERMTERPLGTSSMVSVPTRCMFLATGNNVILVGDLNRRLLRVTIDPQCEQPFLRRFDLDPLTYVKEHRFALVHAALTTLKGFLSSGAEKPKDRLASFEEWSDLVRGAVIWVGENGWLDVEDPVESLTSSYILDPETRKLDALLSVWAETFGTLGATGAEAIKRAKEFPESPFAAVLDEVAGDRGQINPRRLGRWIETRAGRIVDGLRFIRMGVRHHAVVWGIESGSLGSLGEFPSPVTRKCQSDNSNIKGETYSLNSHNSPTSTNPPVEIDQAEAF